MDGNINITVIKIFAKFIANDIVVNVVILVFYIIWRRKVYFNSYSREIYSDKLQF
jgi:hypothetical protein